MSRRDRKNGELKESLNLTEGTVADSKEDKNLDSSDEMLQALVDEPVKKHKEKKNLVKRIKDMKTWKKVLILLLLIVIVASGIAVVSAYSYFNRAVEQMNENAEIDEEFDLSMAPVEGFTNILLLGVDSRDMSNIKGTRSDMIMIASINNETSEVTLTSVFRDTYLKMGDTANYSKITHACAYGGPEMTIKSLNQALDLDISQYAVVNFKVVADVVNAVGGIEVDVKQGEINQLNKYTKQTAKNIGQKKYKLVTAPGVQTLEGVQAVSYGRIRKGVGDDFKRTERMRTVVSLVLEKAKKMSFKEAKALIELMIPQVQTNLKMDEILGLAFRLPQYSIDSGAGWPYNYTAGTVGGVSYVFSSNLYKDTLLFHQQVFNQMDYVPSSTVSTMSSTIDSKLSAARHNNEISGEKTVVSDVKPEEPKVEPNPDETGSEGTDTSGETNTDNTSSETTDPGVTEPGSDTETGNTGVTDPGVTDPGTTDSGVADPGVTDPGSTGNDVPAVEPTPTPEPAPAPEPTPETSEPSTASVEE